MTVTTNSTIEFESKEKLNEYLKANADTFSNVNYLISHINNVWYVTIPRGSIVDSKVQANTYFNASYGINLNDLNPEDVWFPGAIKNSSSSQKYISVKPLDPPLSWNDDSIKNLSQLKLSYIINAIFSSKSDETQFTAYTYNFAQMWKDNHSSYMITKIEAWGVQPTKEK